MRIPLTLAGMGIVLAITLLFGSDATSQSQGPCVTFDALAQEKIPTANPLATGHRWGGEIFIKMGDEYLQGLISSDDGTVVRQPNTGHGKDGLTIIGFGCTQSTPHWLCTDTINIEVPNSIFGPGAPIYDQYQGNSAYINGGTGRFENAYGNLSISGPYIVWNTGGTPPRTGRFNPEFRGHICGVE